MKFGNKRLTQEEKNQIIEYHQLGYSCLEIGKIMKRNHTTILYNLGALTRQPKNFVKIPEKRYVYKLEKKRKTCYKDYVNDKVILTPAELKQKQLDFLHSKINVYKKVLTPYENNVL